MSAFRTFVFVQIHAQWSDALCSFWDTGGRGENNVSANTFFSDARERIFSEKGWQGVEYISAITQSSVGTCQVGLKRSLISELGWLCQPCWEQPVLQPGALGFPHFLPQSRLPKGSQLCFRWPGCFPWPRWLLSELRNFAAAVVLLAGRSFQSCQGHFCQPGASRESQALFASERDVVASTVCGFCLEQEGGHSAARHSIRLPRKTPRAVAARSPVFLCKKTPLLYFTFSSTYFLNLSAAKTKCWPNLLSSALDWNTRTSPWLILNIF